MRGKLFINRIIEDMARHVPREYQKSLDAGNIFGRGGLFDVAAGELRRTKRHCGSHQNDWLYFMCCLYFWAMKESEKRARREGTFVWKMTLFWARRGAVWYALRLWWCGHQHSPRMHELEIEIRVFTKAACHWFARLVASQGFNHHLENDTRAFIDAILLRNRFVSLRAKQDMYRHLYNEYMRGHILGDTAKRVRKEARFFRLKNPSLCSALPPFPKFVPPPPRFAED